MLTGAKPEGPRRSLRPLLGLKPYVLKHPGMLFLAGVALLIAALAMLTLPLAVRRVIDFGFSSADAVFIDQYFSMLMLIGLVLAVASAARFYFVNWIGERVVADLRADVFRHLSQLGPDFYETTHSGEVTSRLTADTTQIKAAAGTAISQALRNIIMLFGALAMMIWTSPGLSFLVLLAIPVIVLPLIAYGRLVRRRSRRAQDTLADASALAVENLAAVRTMQAFTNERFVSDRFAKAVERAFDAARAGLQARAGLTAMTIFLVFASIVGVLWYGAEAVVRGEITGGRLSQFVLYAVFAAAALAQLSEVWGEVSQAAGAAERLAELLAVKPQIRTPDRPMPLPEPSRGEISSATSASAILPEESALSDVSFDVAPGRRWPSSAHPEPARAPSSICCCASSIPTRAKSAWMAFRIGQADLVQLRKRMALVPRRSRFLQTRWPKKDSYGSPHASHEEVERAARLAQAHEFITALPQGYDTQLGERGVSLSGGQRQRVAIARAILRDAPILMLDEATSALDAESEVAVQKALEEVMRGRTTLVIAHRLATIQKADQILVFEAGRIIEEGSHAGLIRQGGLYARLADLQFAREAAQ